LRAPQLVGAVQATDDVADSVLIARPEVAVQVEGDLGGLVDERGLDLRQFAAKVFSR
jgi:hypothetical protein